MASIYILNLRGKRALKNAIFWSKFAKKRFFWPVSSKFCMRLKNFVQNKVFLMLWVSSENQLDRPKKCRPSFRKFFENPPPLEKILDPPLIYHIWNFGFKSKNGLWEAHLLMVHNEFKFLSVPDNLAWR